MLGTLSRGKRARSRGAVLPSPASATPIAVSLYRTRDVPHSYAKDGSGDVHGCGQGGHHVGTPHVPWTAKREPGFDRPDLSLSWCIGRDCRRGRLILFVFLPIN